MTTRGAGAPFRGAQAALPALVARRVDLPCKAAGFGSAPPPCPVHLKFIPHETSWILIAMTAPGMPPHVGRWLAPFGPTAIHVAPGLAPKFLRATFDELPAPWAFMLATVVVHYVELTPEGSASIFVEDSAEKVERFVANLAGDPRHVRERKTLSSPRRVKLTSRQIEAVSLAVALGYYETPHKLNLRELAKKLGLSLGAVSGLLRRGESLIITNYIDSWSQAQWARAGD